MSWKEKLDEAKALFDRAKQLAESEEASAEEKAKIPELIEDARKLKADALQLKDILEEAQGMAEQTNEAVPERKEPRQPAEFKSWEEYLQTVWLQTHHQVKDDRLLWFKDEPEEGHEGKALSGSSGRTGGFLIPDQFIPSLMAVQAETSILRGLGATVIRMASRTVSLPALDQTDTTPGTPHWFGGLKFYWGEEHEKKRDSQPDFLKVNLEAKKLYGLTYASDEVIDDSAISFADFLSSPLGFSGGVVWMEDYAFLRGYGGAQPRGILTAPCVVSVPRAVEGQFTYIDAINMLEAFLPSGTGAWILSHSLLSQVVQMSGPEGNPSYVWHTDATKGISGYLLGMPVKWTEKVPRLGTRGDAMLVDARYYLIGDRQATTIESTKFGARWEYDETSWRVVHRVDGQPWLSRPITYQDGETEVSPFVVLGIDEVS